MIDNDGTASRDDYVAVHETHGPIEEAQLRSFLEAHGVRVRVRGEALRFTHGIAVDGIGAAVIEVPATQVEQAKDLIARVEAGELALEEGFDGGDEV